MRRIVGKIFMLLAVSILFGTVSLFAQTTSITVNGTTRTMIVYSPANLGQNRPLLIALHGRGGDAQAHVDCCTFNPIADTAKFLVVYPDGLSNSWDITGNTDVNFILAIIDNMYTKYNIDKTRVYMTGFSMGGMMCYRAMNTIADKIAAFGPISGYQLYGASFVSSRSIPIIHIHGQADNFVPYSGMPAIMDGWVKRNNCQTTPTITSPYPSTTTNTNLKKVWTGGDCETEVVFEGLAGVGHSQSSNAGGVHSGKEVWRFMSQYSTACGKLSNISVVLQSSVTRFVAPSTVTLTATASSTKETISRVDFYNGTTKLGEDASSPYSFTWANVPAGTYNLTAVAITSSGKSKTSAVVTIVANPAQAAYGGTPWPIPGKIEFENFDVGGNGFAYNDATAGTQVSPAPAFRADEDVDVETCTDAGTGYNVGYATAGEWLEYTVNVAKAGKYDLTLRVACNGDGRTVSVSAKDVVVAKDVAIANTAGWQTWEDVTVTGISLDAGVQVIRITMGASDYVNMNYMTFTAQSQVKPTLSLKKGWNLVGYPLLGSADIATALSSIWTNVLTVKNLEAFYDKSTPSALNTLTKLSCGMGYMVKVDKDCVLQWE